MEKKPTTNPKYTSMNKPDRGGGRAGRTLAVMAVLVIALICFVALKHFYLGKDTGTDAGTHNGIGTGTGTVDAVPAAEDGEAGEIASIDPAALPEYDGHYFVIVNGNVPEFPEDVYERASLIKGLNNLTPYEYYGELDDLGRCTVAYGCLGNETMPQEGEERGDISEIHPSGWARGQNWERCHLIAWALGAENANPGNLVTGTHYMNYDGMRPLEEIAEHFIWNTGDHVLYMAKPWFSGDELVPRGVQLCMRSVEDNGKGLSMNVYCFNVTPGASIDYTTGIVTTGEQAAQAPRVYVINKRSRIFHYPSCEGAQTMSPHNREEVTATRVELTSQGYTPCGYCEP